jgi:GT2 family glycosyltransferase
VIVDRTHILVLNHNGRALLEECLPSVVQSAQACPVPCRLTVVDNSSSDGSLAWLATKHPEVQAVTFPNHGLVSFNHALAELDEPVAILLNNDIKLGRDAIAPLLDAIAVHDDALFAAPQCWTFDGTTYEGMRTRVRFRRGLVQGICRVPGHEAAINQPGLTASAGPVLAVHRERFLALGGYDSLYLPGRLEDLDLGFTGWMNAWRGYYVPRSRAYHRGMASFGPAFGRSGCDHLALRNTLLFAWKNFRGLRLWRHLAWIPPRLLHAALTLRPDFPSALLAAVSRWKRSAAARQASGSVPTEWIERQEAFFKQFACD